MGILTKILNRFSGTLIYEAEVDGKTKAIRLGMVVKMALKVGANLAFILCIAVAIAMGDPECLMLICYNNMCNGAYSHHCACLRETEDGSLEVFYPKGVDKKEVAKSLKNFLKIPETYNEETLDGPKSDSN